MMEKLKKLTSNNSAKFLLSFILPKTIRKYLGIGFFDAIVNDYFKSLVVQIIKNRMESQVKHNDFLQLLIESQEEENVQKKRLTEEEMMAQALAFFCWL